jgi:hypothetical protein
MIPEKIKALFKFIDYLDENKSIYIEKYIPLCNELITLKSEQSELTPDKNYKDKQKYDSIQNQLEEKYLPIKININSAINNKLKELEIWSGDTIYTSIWNGNISTISEFKRNFEKEDIESVMQYKRIYLKFRTETNTVFLFLGFLASCLDEIFKELFDFFKDSYENEFENFEAEIIQVDSIEKAVKGYIENKNKNVKFHIPNEALFKKKDEVQSTNNSINIKNEFFLGDKIQTGDISNNNGNISVGKDIKNENTGNCELKK